MTSDSEHWSASYNVEWTRIFDQPGQYMPNVEVVAVDAASNKVQVKSTSSTGVETLLNLSLATGADAP